MAINHFLILFVQVLFMIELEKTFLAKKIPKDLEKCKKKEIIDIYIPKSERHPITRIRKKGNGFKMTKKSPVADDKSQQNEQTIELTKKEFNALSKIKGKKLRKMRYYYKYNDHTAEVDVFKDDLEGLILVDFEFETQEEKENFKKPDFCLKEITQEEFIAGGMLCGKSFEDIKYKLEDLGYSKLYS